MTGHRIALALLLLVGVVAWAGVNLVVAPALVGQAVRDRAGAHGAEADADVDGTARPLGGPTASPSSPASGLTPASVPSGAGSTVIEAAVRASADATAVADAAEGSATAGASTEPAVRLPFAARSPNFEPSTRTAIFDLVRRLKGEPERRTRLVGRGDPESDGAAAESLARRRAEGVREFMVTLGIPAERLAVEVAPVAAAPSDGAAGEARTVDVFLE